jgi:membrane protease YdiL (CAAX protease family)
METAARDPNGRPMRRPVSATSRSRPVRAAAAITAVGAASAAAAVGFSRLTGVVAESVTVPVGTPTLVTALVLTAWAPATFGWRWGETARRWRLVLGALLGVLAVVALYRSVSPAVPYEPSVGEFLIVPLGEEALFRGFLLVVLLRLFARWLPPTRAARWAVVVGGVAFGAGHLGNLGYVPTAFVLVQALAAALFGILAGWVRVRTDSLVGPVALHAAMNVAAVV